MKQKIWGRCAYVIDIGAEKIRNLEKKHCIHLQMLHFDAVWLLSKFHNNRNRFVVAQDTSSFALEFHRKQVLNPVIAILVRNISTEK